MTEVEKLVARLRSEGFCNHIKKWSQEVSTLADSFYDGDQEDEYSKGDWPRSLRASLDFYGDPNQVFSAVVSALTPPRIITAQELGDAFEVYLAEDDQRIWNDFDGLCECFIDHVQSRVLAPRWSEPFDLCHLYYPDEAEDPIWTWLLQVGTVIGRTEVLGGGPELPPPPEISDDESDEFSLWAKNGISLHIAGIRSRTQLRGRSLQKAHDNDGTLMVCLTGRISQEAEKELADELVPTMRSILRSVSLLRPPRAPGWQVVGSDLASIYLDEFREYQAFITACADVLFLPKDKKDTMSRRFSNAVRLLREADRQTSEAISLSLSVTALEALLGKKGSEMSSALADRVAVLLEPDLSLRSKASEFVKNLYNSRSRILHGEALDSDESEAEKARTLAAGCLYGLWFRSDLKHRLPEPQDTPDALLEELKEHKWSSQQPGGVQPVPAARALWGAA